MTRRGKELIDGQVWIRYLARRGVPVGGARSSRRSVSVVGAARKGRGCGARAVSLGF